MDIFGTEAPKYWEAGLPVIPLRIMDKRPFFDGWSKYCAEMPTVDEQKAWQVMYRANNMGLPLGPQSRIAAIDYDYDNDKVLEAIMRVLKPSPWERVGQRGKVMAYRWAGHKGKKIYDKEGRMVVEILCEGNQIVLPPSIHPKTQKPYVANCHLVDVHENLPDLPHPDDLEDLLRQAISQVIELKEKSNRTGKFRGIDAVPMGSRDVQLTRHSGFLVHHILRGEISVMEAFNDMQTWMDFKVAKSEGDNINMTKGFNQIVTFLLSDMQKKGKTLPPGWDVGLTDEMKDAYGLKFDIEQEEWNVNQLLEYVENANQYAPNSIERSQAINFVLKKISKSIKLGSLETDQILQALRSDTKLPISAFKRQLKELTQGPIEGVSHMEIAEATIKEVQEKHGQIAFWNGKIWAWGGTHWEEMDEQTIRHFIQKEYGELALGKRFSDHKQIVEVLKDNIQQGIKKDGLVQGVNFSNGFLNRDMMLLPHAPEFGMTYTLPFAYRAEASGNSPQFFKFLKHSWGDDKDYEQKIQALREAISSTLFGAATSYQKCFLLYGVPNTGKSVLMNIISAMVPDEARCALSPNKWDADFIAAQFSGKLLNVCGELDEKKQINGKLFKEIISGEEITTRAIYGAPFEFRPIAAHWFASNYLPKTKDTSGGFNRRWLILEFNKIIEQSDIVRDLADAIVYEEIEAIVAWALEQFVILCARGTYTEPESHKERMSELEMQNSNVRQWMNERLVDKPDNIIGAYTLYQDYWNYCASALNTRNLSPNAFYVELNQFLAEKRRGTVLKDTEGHGKYAGLMLREKTK